MVKQEEQNIIAFIVMDMLFIPKSYLAQLLSSVGSWAGKKEISSSVDDIRIYFKSSSCQNSQK